MNKTSRMIATSIKQIELPPGTEDFMIGARHAVALAAHALCNALAREYPAFDEVAFMRGCGVQSLPAIPGGGTKERRQRSPTDRKIP